MTVINIKDKVKNNKLNLSGLNLTEIPVKDIVSVTRRRAFSLWGRGCGAAGRNPAGPASLVLALHQYTNLFT